MILGPITRLTNRVIRRISRDVMYLAAERSVIHVSGPRRVVLKDDEVGAVVLGCDASFFLPRMLEHHFDLGIRCCVYLDNGSKDDSIKIAASYPNVTVLRTRRKLPHLTHENLLRRIASSRVISGGWRLIVDVDELFDYPRSAVISLTDMLRYLNAHQMTGVVAQMLDMVPDGPVSKAAIKDFSIAIRDLDRYSLTAVRKFPYQEGIYRHYYLSLNKLSDPGVETFSGGIRNELFGENCALSKHPLVKPGRNIKVAVHPHISTGLYVADFTCLLRHYKFAGDFVDREKDRVEANHGGGEAKQRWSKLQEGFGFNFSVPDMFRYAGPEELLHQGFLFMGELSNKELFSNAS